MKILIDKESGKKFLARENEDFHTKYGMVSKEDYEKGVQEGFVETNMKRKFFVIDSTFIDLYRRIKRKAQLVPLEILGRVVVDTGIGKDSVIVDAGTGSGGGCCYFGHLCKEVHTFENNEEHLEISKDNAKFLGLNNIKFNKCDVVNDGFKEVDDNSLESSNLESNSTDLVFLDLLEPWKCLTESHRVLKRGGFLAVFNTQITQSVKLRNEFDLLNSDKDYFVDFKTIEIIERLWKIEGEKARPRFSPIGHSGFLTIMRKV